MDAFLSQRARIARHFDSHAKVRSTTHRRAGAFHPLSIQFLLLHAPDVSPVPVTRHGLVAGWITASLVQTRVLNSISRPIHYYAFQGQRQQFGVVDIGPPAPSPRMLRLLAALARPVGLASTESPRNGPCPWGSPQTAIPRPRVPRTLQPAPPRPAPAPRVPPNAGRSGGWCCHPPTPWASGSLGRNCA